jgi:hypothetical protein
MTGRGPGGFHSTQQNPVIAAATPAKSGTYTVADAGPTAVYVWSIENGTITSTDGRFVHFTAFPLAGVQTNPSVEVTTAPGCVGSDSAPIPTGPCATRLYTIAPCRLVDTRSPSEPLAAGDSRVFSVSESCGIPDTARAIAANVTVTNATAAGNLRIWNPVDAFPNASTINYRAHQTRSNNAVISIRPYEGAFNVQCDQATGTVDLIVDVTGYFQ